MPQPGLYRRTVVSLDPPLTQADASPCPSVRIGPMSERTEAGSEAKASGAELPILLGQQLRLLGGLVERLAVECGGQPGEGDCWQVSAASGLSAANDLLAKALCVGGFESPGEPPIQEARLAPELPVEQDPSASDAVHILRTGQASIQSRVLSFSNAFAESVRDTCSSLAGLMMPSSERERSIVDEIGGSSFFLKVAFFLGGHCHFRRPCVATLYKVVFVASFVICFLSCIINQFLQTPPYHDLPIGVLTVYFHVVGLHSWIFWESHSATPEINHLLDAFFGDEADDDWTASARLSWQRQTHISAVLLLFWQLGAAALGFLAFAEPSYRYWTRSAGSEALRTYALVHAILMWSAIPQHVPTFVAGHTLFFFANRLHAMDAQAVRDVARNKHRRLKIKLASTGAEEVDAICKLAEEAQERLDTNCRRWQGLWLHQLAYAFAQILVVSLKCRDILDPEMRARTIGQWQTNSEYGVCLPLFHFFMGIFVLFAGLVTPAITTHGFILMPRILLKAMRHRHASLAASETGAGFLQMRLQGFTFLDMPVDAGVVSKFISLVTFGITALIYLSSGI